MILRDEIDGKVIITALNDTGWYETNIYQITETGLFWLGRYDNQTEDSARIRHERTVNKYKPQQLHICKYCAEMALNYWSLTQTWMCSHHFNIYVKESA